MSGSREPPLGIKVVAAVGALDGAWHVLAGVLRVLGGLLGNPIGFVVGLLTLAIGIGQLGVMYGLWSMEEWGWTWTVRILALVAALDVLGIVLGQGGLLRAVLTIGVLAYVYSQRAKYVRRSYA